MTRTITLPDDLDRKITEYTADTVALSDAEENGRADPDDWAANDDEARAIVDQIADLLDNPQETHP